MNLPRKLGLIEERCTKHVSFFNNKLERNHIKITELKILLKSRMHIVFQNCIVEKIADLLN